MATKDDNILRILVSTDNHLGVWEKDEVRKDDSFVSFEEVFQVAADNGADMVLLGGDLFHDNNPSRKTIVRAMEIMSRHCMGDRPVRFQILSDQAANFTTGRVNYEDPNYNVCLPCLTIHGNHDDPAGAENLSAVDIMSTCRLVNYFGKASIEGQGVGKLRVQPVLMRKGSTCVALYGLGNLRDERLCRLFQTPDCVEWARPAEMPDIRQEDWFNIFVLHQNRVAHTQNAKNCLREGALANFLDLVVWGHEHECVADPWESVEGTFSVMQPGSSVATALSEGESRRKHCVMVEICGQQWRTVKHPLETVRPFQFASLVLAEQPGLDPKDSEGVQEFLERRVEAMIEAAQRERSRQAPELPLIRLRVDYSGFSTINTQRFGQRFVGKVANPNDMVLWQKAPARRAKEAAAAGGQMGDASLVRPEALDESRIEYLIGQHLQHNLEILPEEDLTEALHEFVEKDNKESMKEAVQRALQDTQAKALHDERAGGMEQADDLVNVILGVSHKRKETATASAAQRASQARAERQQEAARQRATASAANGVRRGVASMQYCKALRPSMLQLDDGDDMLTDGPTPSKAMGPPPARKPARAAAAPAAARRAPAAGRGKRTKLTASASGGRQSTLNLTPSGSRATQQGDNASTVGVAAGRRGSRAAAVKAQQKVAATLRDAAHEGDEGEDDDAAVEMVDLAGSNEEDAGDSESESDLEEEKLEPPPSATRKRGRPPPAAAPTAAASRRRATTTSQHTGGTSFVVSDDEDAPQPTAGRRRVGGGGMLGGGGGGRSQGGFGAGSQQPSKRWGELR